MRKRKEFTDKHLIYAIAVIELAAYLLIFYFLSDLRKAFLVLKAFLEPVGELMGSILITVIAVIALASLVLPIAMIVRLRRRNPKQTAADPAMVSVHGTTSPSNQRPKASHSLAATDCKARNRFRRRATTPAFSGVNPPRR